jgi:uncharacterized protein (TIGR03067 family)
MNSAVAPQASMDPAYEVEKKLQGTWIVVSGRWTCQMHFAAHHFALRFPNGDVYLGVYTVDPTVTPAAMDMTIEDGPDKYRGLTALCLYDLNGDTLRWCPTEPGKTQRRTAFPPEGEAKWPMLVLRRDGL